MAWYSKFGSIFFPALTFLVLSGVLVAVIILLRTITCGPWYPNNYEHFQDSYPTQLKQRIQSVQNATSILQSDLDKAGDAADDTCSILKSVERTYISNNSAPSDESEYSLPPEEQQRGAERRQRSASKRFAGSMTAFSESHNNQSLLECFAGSEDVESLEDDLRTGVSELVQLIDSAELKEATKRGQQTWYTLLFTAPMLKKGIETAVPEAFADILTGGALLSAADVAVGKANTIHKAFLVIMDQVKNQKQVNSLMTKKSGDLQKGKVDQRDVDKIPVPDISYGKS